MPRRKRGCRAASHCNEPHVIEYARTRREQLSDGGVKVRDDLHVAPASAREGDRRRAARDARHRRAQRGADAGERGEAASLVQALFSRK